MPTALRRGRECLNFSLASEILARAHEGLKGPFPDESDIQLTEAFLALDRELGLLRTLRGLNAANREVSAKRNAILIFSPTGELEVRAFRDAPDALRALFELEREMPDRDIVLVRADTSDEVRLAFRNYFSDAREFIRLMEAGCTKLLSPKLDRHQVRSRQESQPVQSQKKRDAR